MILRYFEVLRISILKTYLCNRDRNIIMFHFCKRAHHIIYDHRDSIYKYNTCINNFIANPQYNYTVNDELLLYHLHTVK